MSTKKTCALRANCLNALNSINREQYPISADIDRKVIVNIRSNKISLFICFFLGLDTK